MRTEICASDDHDTIARLQEAIAAVGGRPDADGSGIGIGLNRFSTPEGELTVFVDAWLVDVAGPDELVKRLLQRLAEL